MIHMRHLQAAEVFASLTMERCIPLMRQALSDLAAGKCIQPQRSIFFLPHGNSFAWMPAYLGDGDYFGAKVLTAFACNLGTEYPSHMGDILLYESTHGCPVGMVDATSVTQIRTGAVSGAATDALARPDSTRLAIIGAGAQGRSHLEAMLLVRPIREVRIYDLNPAGTERFLRDMAPLAQRHGAVLRAASSPREAVEGADIICTVTPSKEPFLEREWVSPGAHINAVGTFSPTTREVTSALVAVSRFYADYKPACEVECGEYLIPLQEGLISESHIVGSIGDLFLGRVPGRQSETEITLFDALGLAVEDVYCAKYLLSE